VARYYTRIVPPAGLERGYRDLLEAIAGFSTKRRLADAAEVRAVLAAMWADYETLARLGAVKADMFVRDRIRQTQVRPDASGRLRGSISSRPLPALLPGGGIGIADLDVLDHGTINPTARDKGSYWRAQERGTAAHVGRIVPGYFQPGNARPSAQEFRRHPYFEPVSDTRGTPAMVIRRPLRARHFLRDGTDNAVVWHAQREARILAEAVTRLRRIPP
jgi:hypothetical protein